MFEIIIAALIIMLASLVGVIFTIGTLQSWLESRLPFLVSFSAGVFLVTAGAIGLEVFHIVDEVWHGALLIGLGYTLAVLLHWFLPETHQHHDEHCAHTHAKKGMARRIIIGDGVHNIADGVILVASFTASPALGAGVALSILIHEALQEVSEFFVLRQAGYTTKQALAINFAVSSTILLGVGLGYWALASHELEAALLAVSAGFFLHVVAHDLFPKRHQHETVGLFAKHVAIVLIGAILMGLIAGVLTEGHEHGDDGDHDHIEHHDEDDHHEDDEYHEDGDKHHDEDEHRDDEHHDEF